MSPPLLPRRILAALMLAPAAARAETGAGAERAFMERAFALRQAALEQGDQPYGAVVVRAGRIIGEAASAVITADDPTAHAEMQAIRDAARRGGRRALAGAVLYSSSPPCPMCETAAHWAGIARLVHGAALRDGGAPRLGGR